MPPSVSKITPVLATSEGPIKKFIGNKKFKTNIYRTQVDYSMCRYFCDKLIDFMLNNKRLTDFTNLLCPNKFYKNDKIIFKYFP